LVPHPNGGGRLFLKTLLRRWRLRRLKLSGREKWNKAASSRFLIHITAATREMVMARVLVSGGCGFIGRHVAADLIQAGHEVRLFDALIAQVHGPEGDATARDIPPETKVIRGDTRDVDKLAQALHEAEEQRDQAIAYFQQREAEMTNQLSQTEAELRAAMEGLRDARHEAEDLRSYIERVNQG
jgi:3-hydroxyacyl-CoA dehydrogenase